eukprot:CAMPEP_0119490030 /NCGR_PEP_ID=MMETSP1344-20130328/15321_1 /TAXON_ID=236787 /ORGANISM="Florenciella parvula, Strain CCMP2471" /LENGTH=97 /DNA_ID=CAMNT_0007525135 /DNA_START=51 /DNA_END=341 /DNA_ORIENTATION=+
MTCEHCVKTATNALVTAAGDGAKVKVRLDPGMAQVETSSASSASVQDLIDAVETVGFDAAVFDGGSAGGGPHTTRIKIEGMTCGHCTSTCTKALEGV